MFSIFKISQETSVVDDLKKILKNFRKFSKYFSEYFPIDTSDALKCIEHSICDFVILGWLLKKNQLDLWILRTTVESLPRNSHLEISKSRLN